MTNKKRRVQDQEPSPVLISLIWKDFWDNGEGGGVRLQWNVPYKQTSTPTSRSMKRMARTESVSGPIKLWTTLPRSDFPYRFFPFLSISIKGVKRDSPNPHCHCSEKRNLPTPLQPI